MSYHTFGDSSSIAPSYPTPLLQAQPPSSIHAPLLTADARRTVENQLRVEFVLGAAQSGEVCAVEIGQEIRVFDVGLF